MGVYALKFTCFKTITGKALFSFGLWLPINSSKLLKEVLAVNRLCSFSREVEISDGLIFMLN